MENSLPPGETEFDRLLGVMSAIAEAVNKFNDPETGLTAYHDLMSARGTERKPKPSAPADLRVVQAPADETGDDDTPAAQEPPGDQAQAVAPRTRRARKAVGKRSWQRVDVNFRPTGKQALGEFVAERKLANLYAKNTAFVFYLQHILGYTAIGVGHVVAAYDALGWKPSRDPENSIAKTASATGWLDTHDMKAIHTTHNGEHEVKYEMLSKKASTA